MALTQLEKTLIAALQNLAMNTDEDCPSEFRTEHLSEALHEAWNLVAIGEKMDTTEPSEPIQHQLRDDLERIHSLMDAAQRKFDQLDSRIVDWMLSVHNEEGSLPHAIRWGTQAAEELSIKVANMRDLSRMGISAK